MPSFKPDVAFFTAILAQNNRLLNDDYFKNTYALNDNHFEQTQIRGVSPENCAALKAFLTASMTREDEKRVLFLAGTEKLGTGQNGHHQGRKAMSQWFRTQKIGPQIYSAIDTVLRDNEAHPQQLLADDSDIGALQLPDEGGIHSIIEAPVAEAVYGKNALTGIALPANLRTSIGCLMHHAWERYRKCRKRAHEKMVLRRTDYEIAIKDLEAPKVQRGVGQLRTLLRAVKAYEESILWHPKEGGGDVSQAITLVEEMMKKIGKEPKERANNNRQAGRHRASKLLPVELATADEIKSIWALYLELFEPDSESSEIALPAAGGDATGLDEWENDDLGTGEFAMKSEEELMTLLAWPQGRPPIFAKYQSIHGWTEWDDDHVREFAEENASINPEMKLLKLIWHQLGGVSSIFSKLWTACDGHVPGMLLADAVGLGKTTQVMGMIAGIIQVWKGEQIQPQVRPPLLLNLKSFCGKGPVPDLPHAIVVPVTLIDQWYSELRVFFKRHSVDVFRFPSAAKEFPSFWHPDSPWEQSQQPKIKRIVLIAHSTIGLQAGQMLTTGAKSNKNRATSAPRKAAAQARRYQAFCLWNMDWASVTVDEAHMFRTPGRLFHGLNALCGKAPAILLVSATPLYHSPKDLTNLARLIRLPMFLGADGDDRDKQSTKALTAEKRKVPKDDKNTAQDLSLRAVRGEKVANEDDPYSGLKAVAAQWVRDIQTRYEGRIIRRSNASKRYDGEGLNKVLPPYQQYVATVKLRKDEMDQLDEEIKKMQERKGTVTSSQLMNSAFYVKYRTRNAYPHGNMTTGYQPVTSIDDWKSRSSTKIDLLIKLVQHCLKSDNIAMPTFDEDGNAHWPPLADLAEGQQHPRTRKILVSQEFPMMADLIQSVFRAHGIECEVLNGNLNQKERAEAVERFHKQPNIKVLLVSSVGGVGLNLTEADMVICFDILWTVIALAQLIGRCHRLGQMKIVTVFILVALETVDVLMVEQAHAKGAMLETFLTKKSSKGLVANMLGEDDGELSEEDEDSGIVMESSSARDGETSAMHTSATVQGKAEEIPNKSRLASLSSEVSTPESSGVTTPSSSTAVNNRPTSGSARTQTPNIGLALAPEEFDINGGALEGHKPDNDDPYSNQTNPDSANPPPRSDTKHLTIPFHFAADDYEDDSMYMDPSDSTVSTSSLLVGMEPSYPPAGPTFAASAEIGDDNEVRQIKAGHCAPNASSSSTSPQAGQKRVHRSSTSPHLNPRSKNQRKTNIQRPDFFPTTQVDDGAKIVLPASIVPEPKGRPGRAGRR